MKKIVVLSGKDKSAYDKIIAAINGEAAKHDLALDVVTCDDLPSFFKNEDDADAMLICVAISPAFEVRVPLSTHLRIKFNLHTSVRCLGGKYIVSDSMSGAYSGENGYRSTKKFGREAFDEICYSELEIERSARVAYELAQKLQKKITLTDRAYMMTSHKLWRKIVADINEDYPTVSVNVEDVTTTFAKRAYLDDDIILAPSAIADVLSASIFKGGFEALVGDAPQAAYFLVGEGDPKEVAAFMLQTSLGID